MPSARDHSRRSISNRQALAELSRRRIFEAQLSQKVPILVLRARKWARFDAHKTVEQEKEISFT